MTSDIKPGETRWWWVRHGPVINPDGILYGHIDLAADLSDAATVGAVADRLPAAAVWLITPLQRTRQTADALLTAAPGRLGTATPEVEPALIEQHFGAWQGLGRGALYADHGVRHPIWVSPATERPKGGESFVDLTVRVAAAIERLSRTHAGRDIVAVAHGGTIRAAIALALDLRPEVALRFMVDTLSITRLDLLRLADAAPVWRIGGINLSLS